MKFPQCNEGSVVVFDGSGSHLELGKYYGSPVRVRSPAFRCKLKIPAP